MKNLKITLKTFALILGLLTMSCNDDSINNDNVDLIETSIDFSEFENTARFENVTIVQTENTKYDVYENNKLTQKFIDNLENADYQLNKDGITITSTVDRNKFIEINNIQDINGLYTFDVNIFDGRLYENVETSINIGDLTSQKCPPCVVGIVIGVVKIVDILYGGSDCTNAQNACVSAGGLPSTTIETGFFSDSCSVSCAPAP